MRAYTFCNKLLTYIDSNICFDTGLTTKSWGNENSWQLGSCSSSQTYGNDNEYTEQCCLTPGTYTLDCKCSYGDGWHGGFIEIQGSKYCENFLGGSTESVQVIINGGDSSEGTEKLCLLDPK